MPRQSRYNLCDHASHVMQQGLSQHASFVSDSDYQFYIECLKDAAEVHQCEVHAYALMPSHVHLIVTPKKHNGVSKMMQSIGRRYVQYFNTRYDRTGTLWEGRYKASLIQSGEHLENTIQYVEQCPVRSGFAEDASDYQWTSFRVRAANSEQASTQTEANSLCPTIESEISNVLQKCLVYGDDSFKDLIESMLSRKVRPGKRGRPRKTAMTKPLMYATS